MAILIALLIALPLAELWVIIQVGSLIGSLPTIALLLACSLLGAWLVRHQGRAAWNRFTTAIEAGRVPARETADGALIILAGALLVTPGFLTDIAGILLLLPFVRRIVRGTLMATAIKRGGWVGVGYTGATTAHSAWHKRRPGPAADGYDVEGTAVDVDDRQLPG